MTRVDESHIPLNILSHADGQALDLILANAAAARCKGQAQADAAADLHSLEDVGARVSKVRQIVCLLDCYCIESEPQDLCERTLTRIRDAKQRDRFAQQVQALGGSGGGSNRFQWQELLTVAAVLLIGVSLVWPVLERMRADERRVGCASNLAIAGQSVSRYAADHDGALPRGQINPGAVWWNVGSSSDADGQIQSNSAHLYILVRSGYINAKTLQCPDNPWGVDHMDASMRDWPTARAVSYSYQNQYTQAPICLDQLPEMAILADKNPLFVKRSDGGLGLAYRADIDPASPSHFHAQQGQNILISTGQVMWRTKPIGPNGDNIWLIRGVHAYSGVETPSEVDDSFLVP